MKNEILQGDALEVLKTLPDESVDCIVTSPPYFGLRDYGVKGQLGLEESADEFVQNLVLVFREARRVLKKEGSLWLNLGDTYAGNPSGARDTDALTPQPRRFFNMPTDNSKKIILDLCGGTGAWSAPYKAVGYDVRVITVPEWNVMYWEAHPEEDVITFVGEGVGKVMDVFLPGIHGILAAPPCTMFSLARAGAKTPRDLEGAMETVRACLEIIWYCRINGNLKWWALENPVGLTRQFLGAPAMTFEPWQFGDPSKKRTDIWGYFKPPTKVRGAISPDYPRSGPGSWANKSKRLRSITPAGFAKAFQKANV